MNAPLPDPVPAGQTLAITAEALYLINLMLLPVLGFLVLSVVYFKYRHHVPPLAAVHLQQTFTASLWAGFLLVIVNSLIILTGGYHSSAVWVIVILYFTVVHSSLILLGMLGLAKAMAGENFHYPLVGWSGGKL
jgi:hypothetical protein